jgi:hypothetical protein
MYREYQDYAFSQGFRNGGAAKEKAVNPLAGNILQWSIQLKKEDFCLFRSNT